MHVKFIVSLAFLLLGDCLEKRVIVIFLVECMENAKDYTASEHTEKWLYPNIQTFS